VEYIGLVFRLTRHMLYWAVQFEPGKDLDSSHAFSQYNLGSIAHGMMHLWTRPLPSRLKAEMVLVLKCLIPHSSSAPPASSLSSSVSSSIAPLARSSNRCNFVASILDIFVTGCLIPPISVFEPSRDGAAPLRLGVGGEGLQASAGAQGTTSALMYELLLLDRNRGSYEHTLAMLGLLTTLSYARSDALTPHEALRLLDLCLPLLPSTTSASIHSTFQIPAQRWQITAAIFNW